MRQRCDVDLDQSDALAPSASHDRPLASGRNHHAQAATTASEKEDYFSATRRGIKRQAAPNAQRPIAASSIAMDRITSPLGSIAFFATAARDRPFARSSILTAHNMRTLSIDFTAVSLPSNVSLPILPSQSWPLSNLSKSPLRGYRQEPRNHHDRSTTPDENFLPAWAQGQIR